MFIHFALFAADEKDVLAGLIGLVRRDKINVMDQVWLQWERRSMSPITIAFNELCSNVRLHEYCISLNLADNPIYLRDMFPFNGYLRIPLTYPPCHPHPSVDF